MPGNYRTFLRFADTPSPDISGVLCLATAEDRSRLAQQGCTCSWDPYAVCALHPCKCNKCGSGPKPECLWRQKHLDYINEEFPAGFLEPPNTDRITYVQCLELQGVPGPRSARERNLLNLVTALPAAQPLKLTLQVVDKGQSIERAGLPFTATTTATARSFKQCFTRGMIFINLSRS